MKKTFTFIAILGIAVLAFSAIGTAFAHGPNPGSPDGDDPYPYGYGHMGGGYGMGWYGEEGPLHDAMIASLAEALELPADELEARHDAGETLWEIAEAEGLTEDEIQKLMFSAHDQALENAVAEGWLTQEQADWMSEHMDSMWDGEINYCGGYGGMNW